MSTDASEAAPAGVVLPNPACAVLHKLAQYGSYQTKHYNNTKFQRIFLNNIHFKLTVMENQKIKRVPSPEPSTSRRCLPKVKRPIATELMRATLVPSSGRCPSGHSPLQ